MKPRFFRKVLSNGMTILFEKRDLPLVSIAFAVRYGGINEMSDERGIAHFIEHLLYKGTKTRTYRQISKEIEKKGGILNAFTEETATAFWCKIPSKHINIALDVLSDIVKNPLFNEKEIEKERKVIFEEMKLYHDSPRDYAFEKIQEFLYEKPFAIPLIGTHETLNSIGRKKMTEKFRQVYRPDNMILCVVGDCDFDGLVHFAEKRFGKKQKGKKRTTPKIKKRNLTKIETRAGIDQANLVLAFHSPLSTDKKTYATKILMNLMANGLSSRLCHEIREKRNLAYSVFGSVQSSRSFSYSYVFVGTMKEKVQKVKKLILNEFEKVSKKLTEKELNSAKEQIIGNYDVAMEESINQMNHLLFFEIGGNAKNYYEFEKNIRNVKLKDVKQIAGSVKKAHSFFALVPEK